MWTKSAGKTSAVVGLETVGGNLGAAKKMRLIRIFADFSPVLNVGFALLVLRIFCREDSAIS